MWDRLRPWLWPAATLLVMVFLALAWNRAHGRGEQLARQVEAERLRAAGLAAEAEAKGAALEAAVQQQADLRGQLADARRAVPGVRVVEVVKWRTRPDVAAGAPREPPPQGTPSPPAGDGSIAPEGACLLAAGDTGEVRVSEAQLRGPAGSRVVIASAEAWRLTPTSSRLFGGPIQTPVEQAIVEAERPLPRWGAGLMVAATRDRVGAGPVVMAPPLRVWGVQGEASAGCAAGVGGFTACVAAAGVRW